VVTEKGLNFMGVVLEGVSLMGGLFTSVFAATTIFIAFITRPGFTAYMSKNLFTITKYDPDYECLQKKATQKMIQIENGDEESKNPLQKKDKNFARNLPAYNQLRNNLSTTNRLTESDVNNIVTEMVDHRLTMSDVVKKSTYRCYFLFSFLICCNRKDPHTRFQKGRVKQAQRKLEKVQNIIHIL